MQCLPEAARVGRREPHSDQGQNDQFDQQWPAGEPTAGGLQDKKIEKLISQMYKVKCNKSNDKTSKCEKAKCQIMEK